MKVTCPKCGYQLSALSRADTPMARARRAAGMSQRELAAQIGMSGTSIIKIEHGHGNPTLKNAIAIGRVLNIAVEDLMVEEHHEDPD